MQANDKKYQTPLTVVRGVTKFGNFMNRRKTVFTSNLAFV